MNQQTKPQDNVPQVKSVEGSYNSIQPTSSKMELVKYISIRQPETSRDKDCSPLFDAAMCAVADRLKEFTDRETFNKVWTSSLFPERISKQFLRLAEQYADPLNSRIAELEASNAKMREALEPLAGAVRHLDTTSMLRTTVVNRLVKLVVAAEQALNSKEVPDE